MGQYYYGDITGKFGIQLKKCLDETNECNFEANYF